MLKNNNWLIYLKLIILSSSIKIFEVKMFAVVDILGQQFKVTEKVKYYVPRLASDVDSEVMFDNVLIYDDDKSIKVGAPTVSGIKVRAKVLEHIKDDKVIVFKKKRRTGYEKKNGHRQQLTRIEVTKIGRLKEKKDGA